MIGSPSDERHYGWLKNVESERTRALTNPYDCHYSVNLSKTKFNLYIESLVKNYCNLLYKMR